MEQKSNSMSTRSKIKIAFLGAGLVWCGTMITLHSFKVINIDQQKDFFTTTFIGCAAGLGLQKRSTVSKDDTNV